MARGAGKRGAIRPMRAYYDWIYLSPHLDDAALSCGGQIAQHTRSGQTVLIVSVMAGDPPNPSISEYARGLHERWELASEATAARRAEDLAACALLGADALHWDVPDCIYRTDASGAPFYLSDPDIFGEVAPAEQALAATLAAQMADLPDHARLVVPLTVGHHVDHLLVRQAAEQAFEPYTLFYYEDCPYAYQYPEMLAALVDGSGDWHATVIPLSPEELGLKIDAVMAYRSQLSTFFTDRADLEAQIGGFAAATGGERLWRKEMVGAGA